ncbi:hypothetical protein [Arthrobacter globiformis]|uniref:hypothetical protein n=1 Tax=Arthrobacter globiformis TaxID=1665 RepID=UPI000B41AF2B|nr:hypothetical protein [Arthrobacter globiformis]
MYVLLMVPSVRDALRILFSKEPEVSDELLKSWVQRARAPLEKIFRPKTFDSGSYEGVITEILAERQFPLEDPAPYAVRRAAYSVEARRSLQQAMDNLTLWFVVLVIGAILVLAAAGVNFLGGLAVAIVGASVTSLLHRRVRIQAKKAVPFRHGSEPLVWALYYAVQASQETDQVRASFRDSRYESFDAWLEGANNSIEFDDSGEALPFQDEKLAERTRLWALSIELERIFSGRHIAHSLLARAEAAATLVESEMREQLNSTRKGNRSGRQIPQKFAKQSYNYLLEAATVFAALPALDREQLRNRTFLELESSDEHMLLNDHTERLRRTAERAAMGWWPESTVTEWTLPAKSLSAAVASSILGLVLTGASFSPAVEAIPALREAMIGIGVSLIPGTAGKILGELTAIGSKGERQP